jgi:glucose-6-phosphate isomerase
MSGALWERYREYLYHDDRTGLRLDISRMGFAPSWLSSMEPRLESAFAEMDALERGALANPDEGRLVGHYWLRDPPRAPTREIRQAIEDTLGRIKRFADCVHRGTVAGAAGTFRQLLVIGIGGSALGPQLVASALTSQKDRLAPWFIDNTDPDGIDRTLGRLSDRLGETLTLVISKSGGTRETRNGMLEVAEAYRRAGLAFAAHAVAITGEGSELDLTAREAGWLERFPMWDWVGGRTSELSAVGLVPAALQGFDVDALLAGARDTDQATRRHALGENPAALLALMWLHARSGPMPKSMVVLPYKDRLELLARYLQQLVMESLGKESDLDGHKVCQGIPVYGNKGSTDQHAYVQQLRDGPNDFFVTFVEVLRDRESPSLLVEDAITTGDYLFGFLHGTRRALYEKGRESVTITVPQVDARTIGSLIALFERAVGLYAFLVHINAYHQPGVEAGKLAAREVLALQGRVLAHLATQAGGALTAEELAHTVSGDAETVFHILEHAAANPDHRVQRIPGQALMNARYTIRPA